MREGRVAYLSCISIKLPVQVHLYHLCRDFSHWMRCRSYDLFVPISIEILNIQFHEHFCNKIVVCIGLCTYAIILQNVENYLLIDTISHPSRLWVLITPHYESQISDWHIFTSAVLYWCHLWPFELTHTNNMQILMPGWRLWFASHHLCVLALK